MRQLLTTCVALSMTVLMLFAVADAAAQTTLESFGDPGTLNHYKNSDAGDYTLSGTTEGVEGSAIEIEYNLVADQSWGGSVDVNGTASGDHFPDMSGDTGISFYYKAVDPASDPANVNITVKLFENSTGETEEWHAVTTEVLGDDSGEWQQLQIPFSAFAIPSWMTTRGDEMLQLDQVFQWQIQIFGTAGTTTTGTILFDELASYGSDNGGGEEVQIVDMVQSFDDAGALGNWQNSTAGSYTLEGAADAMEGAGSIQLDYNLVADLSWGGSVDIQGLPADTYFPDMSGTAGLSLYYKVLDPASDPSNVNLTFKLFDTSTGDREEWHFVSNDVLGDASGEWQQLLLPFDQFAIPSWMTTRGDEVLNLDNIVEWQVQVLGQPSTTTTGSILFDQLATYVMPANADVGPMIEDLMAQVESVVSGNGLLASHSTSLRRSLEAALAANNTGDVQGAMDALSTFINQVDALRRLGGISAAATRLPLSGRHQFRNILHTALQSLQDDAEAIRTLLAGTVGSAKMAAAAPGLDSQTLHSESPRSFALDQNYPNPFNPTTLISYQLPQASNVTLRVFNMLGQEVMTLVEGPQAEGIHSVRFDATDLPSGLYIYQIQAGIFSQTKTMMLVR